MRGMWSNQKLRKMQPIRHLYCKGGLLLHPRGSSCWDLTQHGGPPTKGRKAGRCRTAPAWGCSPWRGKARKRPDRSWPSDVQLQTAVAQMELENKNPKLRQMFLCTGAGSQRDAIKEPESPFLMEQLIQWALGTG